MSDAADSIGAMATAGLIAREIERAKRAAPAVGHDVDEPCSNCGTERLGPYCHACGQAGHLHRNLMGLVHDIAHGVFHFEGKTWNTLPMLAWRPGELTRRYVHGERAKFVSPMALFLFSVFLMFAVVSNLVAHHGPSTKPIVNGNVVVNGKVTKLGDEKAALETKIATLQAVRAALPQMGQDGAKMDADIAAAQKRLGALQAPGRASAVRSDSDDQGQKDDSDAVVQVKGFGTGVGWFDSMVGHTARNPELAAYKLKTYGYKYSWALIPISIPFIWLLFFWRRDVGLYDHAIFAIYSLTFMSLSVVVLSLLGRIGMPGWVIWLAILIVPPVHMYRQLKGAYLLGRWGATWRTFALLIITTITSSLFLAFLIWMGSD